MAAETGVPVEVPSLTTETQKVTAQPDGSFKAEISPAPVRVKRGDQWVPVDATLERRPDGTVAPKALPAEMTFSNGGAAPLVRLTDDGKSLGFAWPNALPTPVLDGPTATYAEVLTGVDLVVKASVMGDSTYFVVKTAQAAHNPALAQLRFTLQANGVAVTEDSHGGLEARDAKGRLVFAGPQPRMWDSTPSAAPPPAPARSQTEPNDGAEEIIEEGEGAQSAEAPLNISGNAVTVAPDQELLKGADTVYPVIVDPSISKIRSSWGMVWNNGLEFFNHSSEIGRVGFDGWDIPNTKVSRSFYRFDIQAVTGKHILSATLRHNQVHSPNYDCDKPTNGPGVLLFRSRAFDKSITWPGPAAIQNLTVSTKVHGHRDHCPGSTTLEWPIESAVEASDSILYLGMKSTDEGDREGWRKFSTTDGYPVVEISFNTLPYAPTAPAVHDPVAPCATNPSAPTLITKSNPNFGAKLNDSDAPTSGLRRHFYVYEGTSATVVWNGYAPAVGNGARAVSAPVAAGRIADDQLYRFRVRTEESTVGDGSQIDASPFSVYCYFKADLHSPTAPVVESPSYPPLCEAPETDRCHLGTDGVGKPGSFDFSSQATDVVRYEYSFNGKPPISVASAGPGLKTRVSVTPNEIDNVVVVRAFDEANRQSGPTNYTFKARPGAKPVGVWKLNETTGTVAADSSGSATPHPATVSFGGTTGSQWWSEGRLGGSIRLDGVDDYATTQGPVLADTSKSFSVSAWVYLESGTEYGQVIGQAGTNDQAFMLYYSPSYDHFVFGLTASDDTAPTRTVVAGSGSVGISVWTHVAGVWDQQAKQITLYINGRLASRATVPSAWKATGSVQIGRAKRGTALTDFFDGAIDEVKVWNRVIAAGELEQLVNATDVATNRPTPELSGHWTFESLATSGTKRLAPDRSGYGRSAELGVGADGGRLIQDPRADRFHGNVLRLDGGTNDFAKTLAAVVDTSGSYSITAWVRPTNGSRPGPIAAAGSHGSTGPAVESMWFGLSRSSPSRWRFERSSRDETVSTEVLSRNSVSVEMGEPWTHVAAVYDSGLDVMQLYVDGVKQRDEAQAFDGAWHTNAPVWFGAELPGAGRQPSFVGSSTTCACTQVSWTNR